MEEIELQLLKKSCNRLETLVQYQRQKCELQEKQIKELKSTQRLDRFCYGMLSLSIVLYLICNSCL